MSTKKPRKKTNPSPRVAHVDFLVEKEKHFLKYVKYLSNPFHIMWRNFLAGTFHGLGFMLGTAILISIIGFFTSKVLGNLSFFSDFAQAVNIWLDSTLESQQ
jgi:hypothetical protein